MIETTGVRYTIFTKQNNQGNLHAKYSKRLSKYLKGNQRKNPEHLQVRKLRLTDFSTASVKAKVLNAVSPKCGEKEPSTQNCVVKKILFQGHYQNNNIYKREKPRVYQ